MRQRRSRWVAVVTVLALTLLGAASAAAHQRSVSYSSWQLESGGARVRARVSRLDETAAPEAPPLAQRAPDLLRLLADGQRCSPGPAAELQGQPGWRLLEWRVRCPPAPRRYRIESALLFDAIPRHLHFAELCDAAGCREVALADGRRAAELPAAAAPRGLWATAADYLPIGIAHIGSGLDHLAFLLALVLLARRIRPLLVLATGFTVGHSISLSLAVLGGVRPAAGTVEALIGLSVALLAAEAASTVGGPVHPRAHGAAPSRPLARAPLIFAGGAALVTLMTVRTGGVSPEAVAGVALMSACLFALGPRVGRPERLRFAMTALFGLIHGFGFATVLGQLRLRPRQLGAALLGFNLGVELGQIALLALVVAALALLARRATRLEQMARELAAAGALAAGSFWFLTRTLG